MMVRKILNWLDEKDKELDMDKPMDWVKCFGIGFTEGVIDGCVIGYTILIGTSITAAVLNKTKK